MQEKHEPETVEADQGIPQPNPYKTGKHIKQEDYAEPEDDQ